MALAAGLKTDGPYFRINCRRLLAGVLARFGLQVFESARTALPLVLTMLLVYLLSRRLLPRYAVMCTLLAGIAYAASQGLMHWEQVQWSLARPQWD